MKEDRKIDWKRIGTLALICVVCFSIFTGIALAIEYFF